MWALEFLTEQNKFTVPIFIISLIVDFVSIYHVNRVVHDVKLYLVLISTIVLNIIVSIAYLSQNKLFNISPIITMFTIILLCYVLVDIEERRLNNLNE